MICYPEFYINLFIVSCSIFCVFSWIDIVNGTCVVDIPVQIKNSVVLELSKSRFLFTSLLLPFVIKEE